MKKIVYAVLAIAMAAQTAVAQNLKFGKPSQEEWSLTQCAEAPDAPAVVLCKTLELSFDFTGNYEVYGNVPELSADNYAHSGVNKYVTAEGSSMTYKVKMRTKILKEEGKGYANLDVMYYDKKGDLDKRDEFYAFSVIVFSNNGGKVKKVRLDKSAYTDERINDEIMVRRLRIPDVKVGDIVECQFDLFSKRIAYIYDWQFQDDVPVRYSKCEMQIPAFLQYTVNRAIRPNINATVTSGQILLKQEISDLQAPKKVITNDYKLESRDMLPWGIDPVREKAGAAMAEVRPKIDGALFKGIPMPTPLPAGRVWITSNPLTQP